MTIYFSTIEKLSSIFLKDRASFAKYLKNDIKNKTGQVVGSGELVSWIYTLGELIGELNKELKPSTQVFLEYSIPWTNGRIDLMISGKKNNRKKLFIIELKGWEKASVSKSGEINPGTSYQINTHPSQEAKSYKIDLERITNIVPELDIEIIPCVIMPNYDTKESYKLWKSPIFQMHNNDVRHFDKRNINEFIKMIKSEIDSPLPEKDIENINKLQRKPIDPLLMNKGIDKLKLSSSQLNIIEQIKHEVSKTKGKRMILVKGAPGCGKTLVALRLLVELNNSGNKVDSLFPGKEIRDELKMKFKNTAIGDSIKGLDFSEKAWEIAERDVVIFDEGHKMSKMGSKLKQALSLTFKYSDLLIAFVDDYQKTIKDGATTEDYLEYAKSKDISVSKYSLTESFRNGGEASYPEWIKAWLFKDRKTEHESVQKYFPKNHYIFTNHNSEKDFIKEYDDLWKSEVTRMTSLWFLRPEWNLNKNISIGEEKFGWNPSDQWIRKESSSRIVGEISKNIRKLAKLPFSSKKYYDKRRIGYFNSVQGTEYENSFVYIPNFIKLKQGELVIDIETILLRENSDEILKGTYLYGIKFKNKLPNNKYEERLKENISMIKNRLYVLLTRGTKSTHVYIENPELRKYIDSLIIKH